MAARNALTRSLRAEARRDEASLVAVIRRPSWTDWALNRAADEHPESAEAFAAAAEAMREAQAAAVEGRSADVGTPLRALRDRTADLVKQAKAALTGAGRPADVADLTERAAAVAADPFATEQLRAAVLRGDAGDDVDAIRGLSDRTTAAAGSADASPSSTAATAARPGVRRRRADDATDRAAEQMVEQAAERRRTMRELAESERAQRSAAHEFARAERAVVEAEAKRASASQAVDRARRELAETEARLAAAIARRTTVAHEVDAAEQRAAALRDQLDRLAGTD